MNSYAINNDVKFRAQELHSCKCYTKISQIWQRYNLQIRLFDIYFFFDVVASTSLTNPEVPVLLED